MEFGSHHHAGEHDERLTMTDPISDNKRREHQFHDYSKLLREAIQDADEILLFGPGEAKYKFHIELQKIDHLLAEKVQAVETSNSMTENQMKSYAIVFFGLPRVI